MAEVNEILSQLGIKDAAEDGMDIISHLMELPDDQLMLMGPALIDSLDGMLHDSNTRMQLLDYFRLAGNKVEDFNFAVSEALNSLNELNVSKVKKDFLISLFSALTNGLNSLESVPHRIVKVPIELCGSEAVLPKYATDGSAAVDLYATEEITINPGETVLIPTGIKTQLPTGYAFLIHPRSGTSVKTHLRVANAIGLIDSDYRGEIKVIIENNEAPIKDIKVNSDGTVGSIAYGSVFTIGKGERFAQMRLVEVPVAQFTQVTHVTETARGDGGFGSTGKN